MPMTGVFANKRSPHIVSRVINAILTVVPLYYRAGPRLGPRIVSSS